MNDQQNEGVVIVPANHQRIDTQYEIYNTFFPPSHIILFWFNYNFWKYLFRNFNTSQMADHYILIK